MNKYIFLSSILLLLLVIGCTEDPPEIVPCQTDRVVLVEEFTGLYCANCPAAHQKIKDLQAEYPNQIIPVAIHAGYTARPYQSWDYRTVGGNAIHDWVIPQGNPSANINRKYIENTGAYTAQSPNTWAGYIAEEICKSPDVSINLTPIYDEVTREINLTVNVAPLNTVKMKKNVHLSILITESNIIAPQESSTGWDNNYVHNYMLRDFITDTWGVKIQEEGETIMPYQSTFNYSLPTDWDENNCEIVAFVHYYEGDERYILQAAKHSVK